MPQEQIPQPPRSPRIERSLSFHRDQLIGVPILLIVPMLALLGVFGESKQTATAEAGAVEVSVEYPSRIRYKTIDVVEITIRNPSSEAVSGTSVRVETAYLDGFSSVTFTPQATTVTADAYIVELGEIPAGESRTVSIDLQAERYGSYDGTIEVSADGSTTSVRIGTFNFP